jgi:hypothetical protein
MKSKRTKAALKAWETRRENEAFEQRSEAAHKAWATRRRNGAVPKKKKGIQASDVIAALVGNKRGKNDLFDRYVRQQKRNGHEESRTRAAIKAHVTRCTA